MFNSIFFAGICFLSIGNVLQTTCQNTDRKEDEATVLLYYYPSVLNSSERHLLDPSANSFNNSKLAKGKQAKILVHGAGGNCLKSTYPYRTIEAYLRAKASGKEDYNIFCLDYGQLAQPGPVPGDIIPSIKRRFEYVGDIVSDKTADLILGLEANGYINNLDQVHIIGHSLGGQISGIIGRKIQEKTNYYKKIGRITGLDIMNIFLVYTNEVNLENQLDLSDANFVDIYHTSPIGLKGDYGHVDFYPDGGLHQRSCLMKGPVSNVTEIIIGGCSHLIVGKYWENSIDNPNITGCKANSWENYEIKKKSGGCTYKDTITFGEYVSNRVRGKFYLDYPLIKV